MTKQQEMKHLGHLLTFNSLWEPQRKSSIVETQPDMMAYIMQRDAQQRHQLVELESMKDMTSIESI